MSVVLRGTDGLIFPDGSAQPVASLAPRELAFNCGRLNYYSPTLVAFAPYNGNKIKVNGAVYTIPDLGIIANTTNVRIDNIPGRNLSNGIFRVYVTIVGGVPTLDFQTAAGHRPSLLAGNNGVEVLYDPVGGTEFNTHTLVGMVQVGGDSQFHDDVSARFVASWFNRRPSIVSAAGSNVGTGSTTPVPTTPAAEFILWGDESMLLFGQANFYCTVEAYTIYSGVGFDGVCTGMQAVMTCHNGWWVSQFSATTMPKGNEGYHYAHAFGWAQSGAGAYFNSSFTGMVNV